jgi:uncharacterized membrane protein YjjP (DUF1212 family)
MHQLNREELTEVIQLALWAGQLLLQHHAESQRVEETVQRIGLALGCDSLDVFVSTNAIQITTVSGGEFRTRIRRVADRGVNMTTVSAVNRLSRRIEAGELPRAAVRQELERISHLPRHYNRWLVAGMVGLACAAFSRLFGGDIPAFAITFVASALAMLVRQELAHRSYNFILVTLTTAFVASLLASSAFWLQLSTTPNHALTACVLFLVPGVPLINAIGDLVSGHPVVGLARAATGAIILLALALGMILAIKLTGVPA